MKYLTYLFFRVFVFLVGILPWSAVYMLSTLLYHVLFHLLGYRRKVVQDNLSRSFPDKSTAELDRITKAFYKHLADIFIESLRGFSMTEAELKERFQFLNNEIMDEHMVNHQSIFAYSAHFGNWEWGVLIWARFTAHVPVGVYKRIHNKYIEAYTKRRRSRFGIVLLETKDAREAMNNLVDDGRCYIYMSDQSPSSSKHAVWLDFLGQDTAFISGVDQFNQVLRWPVFYVDIRRIKRGYYQVFCSQLAELNESLELGELVGRFAKKVESVIREKPEEWLWSHKRWKHHR